MKNLLFLLLILSLTTSTIAFSKDNGSSAGGGNTEIAPEGEGGSSAGGGNNKAGEGGSSAGGGNIEPNEQGENPSKNRKVEKLENLTNNFIGQSLYQQALKNSFTFRKLGLELDKNGYIISGGSASLDTQNFIELSIDKINRLKDIVDQQIYNKLIERAKELTYQSALSSVGYAANPTRIELDKVMGACSKKSDSEDKDLMMKLLETDAQKAFTSKIFLEMVIASLELSSEEAHRFSAYLLSDQFDQDNKSQKRERIASQLKLKRLIKQ